MTLLPLLLLLSCSGEPAPDSTPPESEVSAFEALPAPALLRRASLDLRGVLPTIEELEAVEADPEAMTAIAEGWFADPRFQDRMVQLLSERWHTLVDVYDIEIDAKDPDVPQVWLAFPDIMLSGRVHVDWRAYAREDLVDELFV